ncbi:radical SAM family heme chaperone HemW [Sediminivirga luteola]|uniref:radical SAM family heme chaperone HemW n=1 Tax=Sediminivirga luteola TaxID=1774748 RepID=UPI001F57CC03|nr:radical SAM family heme chaperone HemW [Sediminivirga luteola]MCI2264203.1 radical SAM family heme chaperone HemW [Sediminivirga luteola]
MPAQPEGLPAPADGLLPSSAAACAGGRPLGLYAHVPYCRVRCGYCDFNTYTAEELGENASRQDYAAMASREIGFAARVLADSGLPPRPLRTVFFGGGTPTLLPAEDLAAVVDAAREAFGLAPGAEITTEANPDTLDAAYARALARAGVTRVSIGMQSAVGHVLAVLDRTHDPARVPQAVAAVRDAGMQVSLDLIYGAPGETVQDWQRSLQTVLELEPDHVSAYSLIVEPGTRMGRQVARGELPAPDEDDLARKYEIADAALHAAGYRWYEVSNWARGPQARCEHNRLYWRSGDWWGVGPGAHSHIGGVRWWNVKHPRPWAARLMAGQSPAHGRELLDAQARRLETVMLGIRTAEGLDMREAGEAAGALETVLADGLIERDAAAGGRIVLTGKGRLLADTVVRALAG